METKTKYLILGAVVIGGYLWYKNSSDTGTAAVIPDVAPTFKSTPLSTLAEMKADLKAWSTRGDTGWNNMQPTIYQALLNAGEIAIKNMHAILWDAWQPGKDATYAYTINWDLSPASWDNSVGKWWENFSKNFSLQ